MEQEIIVFQEVDKFNKPNILINIIKNNSLTTRDKKIYNVLLRKLINQNRNEYQKNEITTSITQISRELNIQNRNEIKETLEKIRTTTLKFNHLIGKKEYKTNFPLLSSISIGVGCLDSLIIRFDTGLCNEILKYTKKYTKIDLIEMNKLKKMYSLPLYELFKSKIVSFPYQPQNYTETELRNYLTLHDKYKDIKVFNRDVIKGSIEDINENTNLEITLISNKIDKKNGNRIYKFFIKQDLTYTINLTRFKNILKNITTNRTSIKYKIKKSIYILDLSLEYNKVLWLDKDLKPLEREMGIKIYEDMFLKYKNNPIDFLESLNIDIDLFIEYDYKFIEEENNLKYKTKEK